LVPSKSSGHRKTGTPPLEGVEDAIRNKHSRPVFFLFFFSFPRSKADWNREQSPTPKQSRARRRTEAKRAAGGWTDGGTGSGTGGGTGGRTSGGTSGRASGPAGGDEPAAAGESATEEGLGRDRDRRTKTSELEGEERRRAELRESTTGGDEPVRPATSGRAGGEDSRQTTSSLQDEEDRRQRKIWCASRVWRKNLTLISGSVYYVMNSTCIHYEALRPIYIHQYMKGNIHITPYNTEKIQV